MEKFVQHDVRILRIVHAVVAEVELSLAGHAAADVERVVGAGKRMRIDRNGVADDATRAAVAERLHVALAAIDLEVDVDLFELRLAAIENQRLRWVGVRFGRRVGIDDLNVRTGQHAGGIQVEQIDDRVRRVRHRGSGIVLIAQGRIVQLRDRVRIKDAALRGDLREERLRYEQRAGRGVDVVRDRFVWLLFDDHAPRRTRYAELVDGDELRVPQIAGRSGCDRGALRDQTALRCGRGDRTMQLVHAAITRNAFD